MLDLSILNTEQKEAVETTEGPVLVLAGAGSGKTRVLTYRIAFILDAGLAGPHNILAMTFTNKAAGEMKERIAQLRVKSEEIRQSTLNPEPSTLNLPWAGTFHSICVKILKIYGEHVGLSRTFTIYDSSDQLEVMKEAMARAKVSTKDFNPRAVHNYISSAKNELITPGEYESYAQGYFQQVVAQVYPEYQKILRENNAVDFDDLIMLTIKLLKENQQVLERFQNDFKYILVDEYQDTNHAQYILVNLFAAKYKNICCVGDDDQSIYSFRGATIKNILNFEKDYPNAKVIKLEQNYRSTKKILEASYQVISKNKGRKDKKLWTDNFDGENITLYTAKDEIDEGRWMVNEITKIEERETNEILNEIAVLYRTNAQSRSLEEAFINEGIPYQIIGGVRFYDRKEIKDVMAYLKVIYNNRDKASLDRIINVPRRGIGDKTVKEFSAQATAIGMHLGEFLLDPNNKEQITNNKVADFARLMQTLVLKSKTLQIVDFLNYLLDTTKYIEMLKDGTLENESRIENIKELISVAAKFNDLEPLAGLEAFLDDVALLEGNATEDDNAKYKVTLMTIHAAKGLEFKHVFVVGVEENLFPHSNSLFDEKELEEERRLAYVAITRAKENLYLTHANSRVYFGSVQRNPLSRFINDIDKTLLNKISSVPTSVWKDVDDDDFSDIHVSNSDLGLEKGDKVKHEYFGVGTIKYIDDEMIEVDFGAAYGMKELMLEYARLMKV